MTVTDTHIGDRYRLGEKVGSGGMSSVYRAFDPTLERWVAIKVMHRDITSDPDQLERFRREARAVAQLNHPHVVTVIDAGEDDGTPYIVLEYVEGETLKDRIRRMGRLPVSEAVAYAIEIGRALSCAHANRLVHRDIKPQNVLIAADGRAKVTDFGIARSLEVQGLTAAGSRPGHHRLRVSRAGTGPRRDAAVGRVLARDRALRDAHRRAALQGRHPGGGGHEARSGAAARRAEPAPRDLGRAGLRGGQGHRQGDAQPLRHGRRHGARPGGGAGDRGRALGRGHRRGHHDPPLAPGRHGRLRPGAASPPTPDARAGRGRHSAGGRRHRLRRHPDGEGRRRLGHAGLGPPERGAPGAERGQRLRPGGRRRRGVPERGALRHRRHPPHQLGDRDLPGRRSGPAARAGWACTWTPTARSAPAVSTS